MDIKKLLEKKKNELSSGIKTTDPVSAAYKLGAYNLCDELLNVIDQNKSKQKIHDISNEKTRWAIKEEPFSTNFNIVTGDRYTIDKCIRFIDKCYRYDKHMLIINTAKNLFPELEWDFVMNGEYSCQELKIECVYSSEGCSPVNYEPND